MRVYERPVRFEEVDAAGIVFFPRFLSYGHEAMETLFDELEGGYVRLIRDRKVGVPAVHVECDFRHPLRYGDVARIETTVEKLGRSSVSFRYVISRLADGVPIASILHVCAVSDLVALKAIPIPDDIRAALERHFVPAAR
jgi:4-hydroxybenzoyl-CoA thioesterase